MPVWGLLTLLSAKKAFNAISVFKNNNTPLEMMPAMKFTAQTNTIFGFLFGIAFLLNHLYAIQTL